MVKSITPVNIRLGVDVSAMKNGMQYAASEIRAIARLTSQGADGATKYRYAYDLFSKAVREGNVTKQAAANILTQLAEKYGVLTVAMKAAKDAEEAKNIADKEAAAAIKNAQQILRGLMNDQEKYAEQEKLITSLHAQGKLGAINLGEALRRLREQYDQLTAAERANAKATKDAADRMAEYEKIMRLGKTSNDEFNEKLSVLNTQIQNGEIGVSQYKAAVGKLRDEYGVLTGSQQRAADLQSRSRVASDEMLAAQERLALILNRGQSLTMKYAGAMRQLAADLRAGRISAMEFAAAMRQLNKEKEAESGGGGGFRGKLNSIASLGGMISGRALVTGGAFAAIGAGIGMAKGSLEASMNMESLTAQTEAMTGSESATKSLIATYKMLDRESMLSMSNFAEGGRNMLAVGMKQGELEPIMRGLGKISVGNEEKFSSLVRAMTQVQTAGKLTAQEMLQFTNAGWSPLANIAKRAGETMAETKKRIEEGGVTVSEVKLALMDATTGTGMFADVNDKMGQTWSGVWAKIKTDFEQAQIWMGQSITPALMEFSGGLTSLGEVAKWVTWPFRDFIKGLGLVAAGLKGGIKGMSEYMDKLKEMKAEQDAMEATAKAKKAEGESGYISGLESETRINRENIAAKEKVIAHQKEIDKLEKETSLSIEKKWYKAKYGEEAEIKRLRDKMLIVERELHPEEQLRLNEKLVRETEVMEAQEKQRKNQEKMLGEMQRELNATRELIDARKRGLVVSEEDLKKHEKMKEFGTVGARVAYERMYAEKVRLDTEQKQIEKIQKEALKNQEKFSDPRIALRNTMLELNKQRQMGLITEDVFRNASTDAGMDFMKKINPDNISTSHTKMLRADSAEGYRWVAEQNERRQARAEAKENARKALEIAQKQLDAMQNAPVIQVRG